MKKQFSPVLPAVIITLIAITLALLLPTLVNAQALFQLNGNGTQANLGNECYRLTTATNTRWGSIWYRKKADLTKDFDLTANLYFGTNNGGADGIVFAFQNQCTSSGSLGGSIGIGGVAPSLLVEFDTWQNTPHDPTNDHVAILKNGSVDHLGANSLVSPVCALANCANIENGQFHEVRILWTAADTTLKVYFAGSLRLTYSADVVRDIFSNNPYVYWGFTAATGAANNDQRVCMLNFPENEIKLSDVELCFGESTQVFLPGGTSYSWVPTTGVSNPTSGSPILSPETTTQYVVSVSDACNNVQTDTINVTVNPLPNTTLNLPFSAKCSNDAAVALSGGSPSGGIYSGSGVNGNQFIPNSASTGTNTIIYTFTDAKGCTNSASNNITVNVAPNVQLQSIAPSCINAAAFALTGGSPSGGTYSGTGVSVGQFSPAAAGVGSHIITYNFSDSNNCSASANTTITVFQKPVANIITPEGTVICSGTSVTLEAETTPNVSYEWFFNSNSVATGTSYTANVVGDYQLKASTNDGCEEFSSVVTITSGNTPSPPGLTATATEFCPGKTVELTATFQSGENIAWLKDNSVINNQSNSTYIAASSGSYVAQAISNDGCKANSTPIVLNELQGVTATLAASLPAFCPDVNSITLTATNASNANFYWRENGSEIASTTANSYNVTSDGLYSVVIVLQNGCSDTSSVVVLNNASNPVVTLTVPNAEICQGSSTAITATSISGASYTWLKDNLAVSGTNNTLNVNQAGVYKAVVVSAEQCTGTSNELTISIKPLPEANIAATANQICQGSTTTISANEIVGATYEWFRNNISLGAATANDFSIDVTQAGAYKVAINDGGCAATSNTINLQVTNLPGNAGNISGTNDFCAGDSYNYSIASVTGATDYFWEIIPANGASIGSGQGTRNVTVNFLNQNVQLKVTPRNSCGNGSASTESVTIDNSFFCTQGNVLFGAFPTNTCQGGTVTFYNYTDGSIFFGTTVRWNFGAGASPATATGNGPHTVTYNSSGLKDITLEYVDDFSGFPVISETKFDYINVTGTVSTSDIVGNDVLDVCSGVIETYSVENTVGSTYQWTVPANATILSGQGTAEIVVNFTGAGGTVSVKETNAAGCQGTEKSLLVDCTVDMASAKAENIFEANVYPNPTSGKFFVELFFSENKTCNLSLYDVSGKIIKKQNIITNEMRYVETISLNDIAKGIYWLRIDNSNSVITKRVVVQ